MNKSDGGFCLGFLRNPELLSKAHKITLVVVSSIISLTTVSTNMMVILAIVKLKQHKKPSHRLLIILSCSDVAVGLFTNTSFTVMMLLMHKKLDCFWTITLLSVFYAPILLSACLTFLECIERIIHIRFIEFYTTHITTTKITFITLITGIAALCFAILLVLSHVYDFFVLVIQVTISIDTSIFLALTLAYIKAYKGLCQRIRDINWTEDQKIEADWENTLTKSVMYFIISLWISWGPYCVIAVVRIYNQKNKGYWDIIFLWVFISCEINSTLNALSVLIVNKRLRKCVQARLSSSS